MGPKGTKLKPRSAETLSIPPPVPGKSRVIAISVLALTRALTSMSGRLVLDETNLTGDYDIVLDYWVEASSAHPNPT